MRNFTFSKKWYEVLKSYPEDIRNQVYAAVLEYAFTGMVIDMQPLVRMAFDFIRYDMEERLRRRKKRGGDESGDGNDDTPAEINGERDTDIEDVVNAYYSQCRVPASYSVEQNGRLRKFSGAQIRELIANVASDVSQSGLSFKDKREFLSKLEEMVDFGANQICYLLDTHKPNNPLNDSLWEEIFNKTRKIYRSKFL